MNVDGQEVALNVRGPAEAVELLCIAFGLGMGAVAFVAAVGQGDVWEQFLVFCEEQKPGSSVGMDRLELIRYARVLGDASMALSAELDASVARIGGQQPPAEPYPFELTDCTSTDGGHLTPGIRLEGCTSVSSDEAP